jgi:hypothetical protein
VQASRAVRAQLGSMSSVKAHETLKLLARGDLVAVQPAVANGNQVQTLSVDLSSGQAQCSEAAPLGASVDAVLALVGIFNFKAGSVLAAVTQAEKVCTPSATQNCQSCTCSPRFGTWDHALHLALCHNQAQ